MGMDDYKFRFPEKHQSDRTRLPLFPRRHIQFQFHQGGWFHYRGKIFYGTGFAGRLRRWNRLPTQIDFHERDRGFPKPEARGKKLIVFELESKTKIQLASVLAKPKEPKGSFKSSFF